jgi:hypothetical protein
VARLERVRGGTKMDIDNPYVGPRTFTQKQKDLFFGREGEARDLRSLVMAERLVLFYAQSGAGKSSLINARLVPQLIDAGFVVLPIGRVGGELPDGISQVDNVFVFNLMLKLDQSEGDPGRFTHMRLADFLANLASEDGQHFYYTPVSAGDDQEDGYTEPPHVLIIDQFEEIFTDQPHRWQDREPFFRQLDEAMAADPLLWVVLSLREDYIAALEPYAPLLAGRMHSRFYMQRMDYAAALDAVKKPAMLAGRPFAKDVGEILVNNLCQIRVPGQAETQGGQYVAPVQLQVVCYRLWNKLKGQPGDEITAQDLENAGSVDNALADFYDMAISSVVKESGVSEITLRKWFERKLITEDGTRGTVYQGTNDTGGLPNQVVKALERQFLIRADVRGGGAWYELVHDRFIEPVLQANRAWFQQNETPLQHQAALWQKEGRPDSLLLQDEALESAESSASVQHDDLTDHEREFLVKCRMARDNAEREKAAALKREAEQAKRTAMRFRLLWIGTGAFALIALVASVIALWAYQQREYMLIDGQVEVFRKKFPILEKGTHTIHARNVFGSVATHLWSKGDDRSLAKLIRILETSDDLIPEDYGADRQGYGLPFVDAKARWPLTVKYNPKREFSSAQLLYEWRIRATYLATSWGIPAPMRLKIQSDPDVPENDLIIMASTSLEDNQKPLEHTETLLTRRDQVLVSVAELPQRLRPFFDEHKNNWTPVRQAKPQGSWYLAPKWTQPLWKVATCDCFPNEAAIALVVANSLLEHPELILTPASVKGLLDRLRGSYPLTVNEALSSRGDTKALRRT